MARSKRRANGEGSFYQLEDRTWVYQITLGRKPDGTLERKSFKADTQRECIQRKEAFLEHQKLLEQGLTSSANEEKKNFERALMLGHSVESEITFAEAFPVWLDLYKMPPTVKPATYSSYLDMFYLHFNEVFGEMKLFEITQDVIQEYYLKKQLDGARKDGKKGGLSAKTIKNQHMLMKDFFQYALKKYKLACNPTDETKRPQVITKEVRVLTLEEINVFLQEVVKETQRIAILFGLNTGVRIGELLALEIGDLDLARQTITVQRNLTRVKTKSINLGNDHIRILNYNPNKKTHLIIQDTPKTQTSNREIPLSDDLCELVLRHIYTLEKSTWPNPDNLLFPSTRGTHIDPKSYDLRLRELSRRCEIKKVNPHALRHTFASQLTANDVPLTVVKDLLGHASVSTTEKYMHKDVDVERNAVERVTRVSFTDITDAQRLNGSKKLGKFAELPVPDFSTDKKAVLQGT